VHKLTATRGGTIIVGALAALLAAAIMLVYTSQYRDSLNRGRQLVSVLVAKHLITPHTPGNVVGSDNMYEIQKIAKSHVKNGAITDPSTLRGRVAVNEILPGQQLTTSDFTTATSNDLTLSLTKFQRAISMPLDSAHGLVGDVQTGNYVDVIAGFNVQKTSRNGQPIGPPVAEAVTLLQKILVLSAPSNSTGIAASRTSNVVLRLTDQQATKLAYASDNGNVWIVLRSQADSLQHFATRVDIESELFGTKHLLVLAPGSGQ